MKEIATKTDGVSSYSAAEFNPNMTELENAVLNSDQTLDEVNLNQLGEAMGRYGGGGAVFYVDSGVADAYVLTGPNSFIQSKIYFDGMQVTFLAANTNTGSSTINAGTIGVVNIKDSTGNALGAGFIKVGNPITAIYNDGASEFRVISTGSSIPFGLIGLFVGAIVDIPTGWQICDGTNGTPDLRNSFIRGAGSTFAVDETGGSETTGGHSLSIAELAAHSHNYNFTTGGRGTGDDNGPSVMLSTTSPVATTSTGSGSAHTHPNTVPPFYALAFMMKL